MSAWAPAASTSTWSTTVSEPIGGFIFADAMSVPTKDVIMVVRLIDNGQTLDVWCPRTFSSKLTPEICKAVLFAVDDFLRNVPRTQ